VNPPGQHGIIVYYLVRRSFFYKSFPDAETILAAAADGDGKLRISRVMDAP